MQLAYRTYGEEHGDAGAPLVILHGLLGSGGNWHTLSSSVFSARRTVHALDLRNHGRSPHDEAFDYPVMAGDVVDFLDDAGIRTANLLGHSMGGKVAMRLALDHPERVERLLVADMAPRAYTPRHDALIDALRTVDLAAVSSRQDVDERLKQPIPSYPVRQFLMKNLALDRETKRYYWQVNLPVIDAHYDRLNEAVGSERPYTGPTLFIRGSRSDYVRDGDLPLIRELFPSAQVVTLDAGHWLHAEAPDAFARAVEEFLER